MTDTYQATIGLEIQRLRLEPGDVLVVKVPDYASKEVVRRSLLMLRKVLDGSGLPNEILALQGGVELEVLSPPAEPAT